MQVTGYSAHEHATGRWDRKRVIGRGGQGRVFLVTDSTNHLTGEFALKEISRTARRERIDLEILTTKTLFTTGAPVWEIVDDYITSEPKAKRAWYVTPFISSGNLRVHLGPGPYGGSDQSALEMCNQLVTAVKSLHARRVAHRDLKPENVLVASKDKVLLCDLGISLALAEGRPQRRLTRVMEQMGSRHYMAPEALLGRLDASEEQFALDIYAVGKIAYELLEHKSLPGVESHRSAGRNLTPRNVDFDPLANRLFDGLLNTNPEVRKRTWARVEDSLRMLVQSLGGGRPVADIGEWEEAKLKLSAAVARRVGTDVGKGSGQSDEDWTKIVNDVCSRLLRRMFEHTGLQMIKFVLEEPDDVATIQKIDSGINLRELLEGAYVKSHQGIEPLSAAGWRQQASPASVGAITVQARNPKVLPSYWLVCSVAREQEQVRALVCIVRKEPGNLPYTDVILGSVTTFDGDPLDLGLEDRIWEKAVGLVKQLFDQLLNDVGHDSKGDI